MTSGYFVGSSVQVTPPPIPPATPTGYPFLQIARRYGLNYGDVLLGAESWRRVLTEVESDRYYALPAEVQDEINTLMNLPVADRGKDPVDRDFTYPEINNPSQNPYRYGMVAPFGPF